ncbi:MAG: GatB/YqeY domain-containing protein [Ignavibacteriota bacterium]
MPLIDQVQKDMVVAMKSREEARLSALRMIKAALMKLKVDSPKPVDEAAEMQLLKQLIKQRIDSAEMFRKGGRPEQADKEEAEKGIIESYLPAGASEAEIDSAVAEAVAETGATSIKQMGLVMKAAQSRLQGKTVDGKLLSDKVKAKLS